jgi:hypothetical protein
MPIPHSPRDAAPVDDRYAALVKHMADGLLQSLQDAEPALSPEQRASAYQRWEESVRPGLISHLDALVGPARPVIAEACVAYNKVPHEENAPKEHNVCKGETVAVVTRRGRPETPGGILFHYPGCEKHARLALAQLGATEERTLFGDKVFHSIMALDDARREIRQQELAHLPVRRRRWWQLR